jgi:hypothetical protein
MFKKGVFMKMNDVDDHEINEIQKPIKPQSQISKSGDITDEQLIAMTRSTIDNIDQSEILDSINKIKQNQLVDDPIEESFKEPSIREFHQESQSFPMQNQWRITGLPSKGRLYPDGSMILGRALKVLEVKKLATINDENADFVINDILKRTLRFDGMKFEDLYISDKLFIIMWLRANTYRESGYVVDFECDKCKKQSQYHFNLDKLEVQYLSDDYQPNKEICLPSGNKITFNYLTISDEMFIERFKEMNSSKLTDVDDELLGLAKMITSINGDNTKTLIQKYHWITNANPGDFAYIIQYTQKHGMAIQPYFNVECTKCGGSALVGVSFRAEFFIPEYKFE